MTPLATHLGGFLREYLPRDRLASPRTIESYAYAFQMFACFAAERLGVRPCNLVVEQLTAPLVLDFLDALQRERATRSAPALRGSPRSSRSSATWSTACPRASTSPDRSMPYRRNGAICP